MEGFAIFRLPRQSACTLIEGEACPLLSYAELNGQKGFVVAPFAITPTTPLVLIRKEKMLTVAVGQIEELQDTMAVECFDTLYTDAVYGKGHEDGRLSYAIDFANFHSQLLRSAFQKIVLARCYSMPNDGGLTPLQLFAEACRRYPRMFVALVSTPLSGTWLTATPEVLLERTGDQWRTVALAGTQKLEGQQLSFDTPLGSGQLAVDWSAKNIVEHRIVVTYVAECLEQFLADFREEGPITVRAANLVHLRSDFTFTLPDRQHIGDLLQTLHPTPAVCGLPKRDAFRFIMQNEHTPRLYYSGFTGALDLSDKEADDTATHLYVTLRCMNITRSGCHLYAGGGLLPDSDEEQEWQETEAKLDTMRQLLKS